MEVRLGRGGGGGDVGRLGMRKGRGLDASWNRGWGGGRHRYVVGGKLN
jgi:hypothetical protein